MIDYSKCSKDTLHHHMADTLLRGVMSARYNGVYYEEEEMASQFREQLGVFVAQCNDARTTAEGYELFEDLDPVSGVVTFYVMREDGVSMLDVSVFFVGKDFDMHRALDKAAPKERSNQNVSVNAYPQR